MPTPRRICVTLPIPSGQLGPNGRVHWRKKHELFKAAKYEAHYAIWPLLVERKHTTWTGPVDVDILWVVKSKAHICDVDNLMARVKPYFDGGQSAGLYENDRQVQVRSIRREVGSNPRVELTFEAVAQEGGDGT
jgi:Holliday junction resolvase RusA-like endonuclease